MSCIWCLCFCYCRKPFLSPSSFICSFQQLICSQYILVNYYWTFCLPERDETRSFELPVKAQFSGVLLQLLYVSKITHTYFYFLLGPDNVYFLSSHGSSLISLPFPPSFCCSIVFIHVTCAVSWFV